MGNISSMYFTYTILVDETLSMLVPRLERQQKLVHLAEKLSELGQKIKMNVTICTQLLEMEKEKFQSGNFVIIYRKLNRLSVI